MSVHKFIGSPHPFGVVLTRKKNVEKIENYIEYLGSINKKKINIFIDELKKCAFD